MVIVIVLVVVALVVAFFLLNKKPEPSAPPASRDGGPRSERSTDQITRPEGPRAKQASERPPATEPNTTSAGTPPEVEEAVAPAPGTPSNESSGDRSPPPPPVRTPKPAPVSSRVDLPGMRRGLSKSRQSEGFFGKLKNLLGGKKEIAEDIVAEIEEVLLTSDVGVKTTERILAGIKERLSRGELGDPDRVWAALREEALSILDLPEKRGGGIQLTGSPTVVLFVGVNGAGKTTTIGKLARKLNAEGKKVMLAAGDTFRAAAVDQLKAWGERTSCTVFTGKEGADPSSVLFDAVQAAKAQGVDVLLADTAGRLHTKTNLMQEMTKIAKTAGKALDGAPHEVLLVLDSTNGQNALAQAKEFGEALPLSGLVLTKLDGTARGGVVLGICGTLGVPVRYVGLGEKAEDLHEFAASAFVEALLGRDGDEIAA